MNQQFYVPQVIPNNNMMMNQKINQHMQPQKIDKSKKPKGRMSNYTFFVQMCREEHRKKHPNENVNFTEFSKKCAERWKVRINPSSHQLFSKHFSPTDSAI